MYGDAKSNLRKTKQMTCKENSKSEKEKRRLRRI